MLYNITYELKNSEKDYSQFLQTLKTSGSSAVQCMKNSWFVVSGKDRKELFELLKEQLESADLLLVCQVSLSDLTGWLPSDSVDWLKLNS